MILVSSFAYHPHFILGTMRSYEIIHCQDSSKMAQPLLCQAQAKVIRTFKKCPNPPKSRHRPSFKMIFWQTHSFFGQATFLKKKFYSLVSGHLVWSGISLPGKPSLVTLMVCQEKQNYKSFLSARQPVAARWRKNSMESTLTGLWRMSRRKTKTPQNQPKAWPNL